MKAIKRCFRVVRVLNLFSLAAILLSQNVGAVRNE